MSNANTLRRKAIVGEKLRIKYPDRLFGRNLYDKTVTVKTVDKGGDCTFEELPKMLLLASAWLEEVR